MSTIPNDKTILQDEMAGERSYSVEDFRKKFDGEALPSAFVSLARSAVALAAGEADSSAVLIPHSGTLGKDGCDFIAACFYFLTSMGVPSDATDFVLCLAGISAGKDDGFISVPDVAIAAVMGLSEQTVRAKRKSLKTWMQARSFAIVEIIEGEFDWKTKKNSTTQYRLTITPLITKVVLLARSGNAWRLNEPKAQQQALKAAAIDTVYETPEAPLPVHERKKTKVKNVSKEVETKRKSILTFFQKIIRLEWKQGHDPSAMWEELRGDMQSTLDEEVQIMNDTGGVF